MFRSARIKLTLWYLLIIMLISLVFSVVIYTVINQEYSRIERVQKARQERIQQGFNPAYEQFRRDLTKRGFEIPSANPMAFDPQPISEARGRLVAILSLVNLTILFGAGIAGYFLAGRTLRPIKEMVDEQNRFITDASHELRTPLTSLKAEIEVNLRDGELTLKDAKKLLQSNLEEVNKLQYLSDGLIKLTQNKNPHSKTDFSEKSILEIATEAQQRVSNLAKHKNITIKNQVKDYIVQGDRLSLIEVFVILLDNAIKYSPSGKVITLNSKQDDEFTIIEVKDQGMGIAKEDLPHIFDRFYRADKSRAKSNLSGYGLGLSIAKQIIDKHTGEIKINSRSGKGTTFSILLPAKNSVK